MKFEEAKIKYREGKKIPQYMLGWILSEEYAKHGIKFTYNNRNHSCYLSIATAPQFIPSENGCLYTGYLIFPCIDACRDVYKVCEDVRHQFLLKYAGTDLAKYADNIT